MLERNAEAFAQLHDSTVLKQWFASRLAALEQSSAAFLRTLDVNQVPAPCRIAQLRDFASFPMQQIETMRARMRSFAQLQTSALHQLATRRDGVLNGEVKHQLTEWWLAIIRKVIRGACRVVVWFSICRSAR